MTLFEGIPGALLFTHAPYWVAVLLLVLLLRRIRRAVEDFGRAVDARSPRKP